MTTPTRRRVLAAGAALTPIAGCLTPTTSTQSDVVPEPTGQVDDAAEEFAYEARDGYVVDELPATAATPDAVNAYDEPPAAYDLVETCLVTVDVTVQRLGDGPGRPPHTATTVGVFDTERSEGYANAASVEIRPADCADCAPVAAALHDPLHTDGTFELPNAPSPLTPMIEPMETARAWSRTAVPAGADPAALRPAIWPSGQDSDPVVWDIDLTAGEPTNGSPTSNE